MICHDRVTLQVEVPADKFSDDDTVTKKFPNLPADIVPLDSTSIQDGQPLRTRYRLVSRVDLLALVAGVPGKPTVSFIYKTKTLRLDTALEVHRVAGRFHHVEAVIRDFYEIGM